MDDTTTLWALIGLAIVAILIVAVVASRHRARVRRAELQRKFGPEYDRAVEEYGPDRADRELLSRERRVGHFQSRELNAVDRARFLNSWSSIQAQFVDDPGVAVTGANELINEVMRARGYPTLKERRGPAYAGPAFLRELQTLRHGGSGDASR